MTSRDGWGTFKQVADAAAKRMAHEKRQQRMRTETFSLKIARYHNERVAFTDGTEEEIPDKTTGEIKAREKYHWFSKSQVSLEGYEAGAWPAEGTIVEATLPEWLAKKVGLLE